MRPTGSTFYYFFFLLLLFGSSYAQVFPVQGSLQMLPPFSPYLTDYTTPGSQKLTLQLRPNDITLGDHSVRLRLSIEGVGITIRTKPNYIPPVPHTLMGGGTPTILYGEDLSDYFNPDNIDFAGFSRSDFQKSGKLPEGVFRFSFEVFDYYRRVPLSNKIMAVSWVVLNDPPLLNLPLSNTKITLIDPVNIAFTWTPRHTASPNAAFSTEYVFKLVEIWPANRNPYDAFLSQPPLYEATINESQLIYGPAEPALITGRKYAWQVQAKDVDGKDIFKNQGKSEVFVFQFGNWLGTPENLRKEWGNDRTLTLRWDPSMTGETPDHYNIRYKALAAEVWYEALRDQQWVTLENLQPNTDYDVQVRSKKDNTYSDYTAALRLKTAESSAGNFVCGQPPATVNTDKTSRLLQLTPGDIFTCNDWRIVVSEASRATNGEFAGKGLMAVKMFGGASIEVIFRGHINASYQLITGGVESLYNKGSEMGSIVEEMKKIGEKKKDTTKTNIDSLPLPQLQELAQSLIDIPQERIDNALVLNREEKQQINEARTKAKEALNTLNDPKATDKEKKEAEKNLRKAVADAKPAMDKLTNSDKDKQAVADRWFKNIMDFLNAYKGNETDKKQAIVWHNRMDSMVNALSKKTGVPNDLMKAMLDAHQNAGTAWANLEKGTDGIRPKGPSANFEEGYTPEDIALCKKEVEAAEAVEKYSISGMREVTDTKMLSVDARAQLYWNAAYWKRAAYILKEHFESQAQFKNVRMNCSENSCEIIGDVTETGTVTYQVYVTFSSSMTKAEVYAILNDWKVDPYNADIELAETFTQWYRSFISKREHLIANNEGFEVGFANLLADVLMAAPGAIEGWITGKHWRSKEELALWQHALGILDVVPGEAWAKVGITALVIRIGSKAINISKLSIPLQHIIQAASKAKLKVTAVANEVIVISSKSNIEIGRIENGKLIPKKVLTSSDEILSEATDEYQLARKGEEVGFVKGGSGVGSMVNSLKKLVGKTSSENILWKNLDETNIIWSNPNSSVLSTAKSFANETGTSLYDAVLTNGYYVKFDMNSGRILLGSTNGNYHAFAVLNDADLGAFKSSVLNANDEIFNTKLSQLLSTNADKLKVLSGVISRQLTIAGKAVNLSTTKVNTMLGRFRPDIANLFDELGSFKNVGLGETNGGINILNKPDHYYNASTWWNAYNKPWLDKAIARGDDIYLATIPTKADDIIRNGQLLGANAEELNHIAIKNYKPVNITVTEWNNIKSWLGY